MSEVRMKGNSRWTFAIGFLFLSLISANAQSYSSELNLGVEAYRNSHFEEAIQHFRKATELDPSNTAAHLYLATACASQFIPGVETPDNIHLAEQAIEQYQHVLDSDAMVAAKIDSTKGIAYLYLNMKRFDDAKQYYQKASGLDPNDPEPYYSMGVIDWTLCYQPRMEARATLGLKPEEQLDAKNPDQKKACGELRVKNMKTVEDAIDNLNKAIQLRPDYDDAMAYMNLMYREKGDLECDNQVAREEDLKTADHWVDETLRVKKMKAEKAKALAAPAANSPQ
jgi:tetratricopeptide (TPR) repeat protein